MFHSPIRVDSPWKLWDTRICNNNFIDVSRIASRMLHVPAVRPSAGPVIACFASLCYIQCVSMCRCIVYPNIGGGRGERPQAGTCNRKSVDTSNQRHSEVIMNVGALYLWNFTYDFSSKVASLIPLLQISCCALHNAIIVFISSAYLQLTY